MTWPTSSAPPPKACAASVRRTGGWSTRSSSRHSSAPRCRSVRASWPKASDRPARRQGRGAAAHRAHGERRRAALRARDGADRPRAPHRHVHRQGARRRATDRHRRHRGRRRRLVAAGDGARARRRDPARCAPTSSTSACGCSRPRAMPRRCWRCDAGAARARRPLVRARDARPAAPHASARLDVSSRTLFALIEPGSCFAGTLARTGARLPTAATCWRCPTTQRARRSSRCRTPTSAPTRWPTARRRLERRFYGEAEPLRAAQGGDRPARSTPTPHSRSAW